MEVHFFHLGRILHCLKEIPFIYVEFTVVTVVLWVSLMGVKHLSTYSFQSVEGVVSEIFDMIIFDISFTATVSIRSVSTHLLVSISDTLL